MKKTLSLLLLANAILLPATVWANSPEKTITRQQVIQQKLQNGEYSKYQALKYQLMARKNPELLPDELKSLPNNKIRSATGLHQAAFLALQDPELDADTRHYIEGTTGRPNSIGSYDSDKYPIRVHYTNINYSQMAQQALQYAEKSWDVEVGQIGFLAPLTDEGDVDSSQGGNNYIDIYINSDAAGAAGYTAPEGWNDKTAISDCYGYIVVEASAAMGLSTTIAHELNHAMQMSYDCIESASFMENTATYVMNLVFPSNEYIGYLPDFQMYPELGFDTFSEEINYQYGAMLVAKLLDEAFGKSDGTFLRSIWERCSQESFYENEPDYFDAIAAALQEKAGIGFDEFQAMLTEWRFFTGSRDDGKHFKEADKWPSSSYYPCSVPMDNEVELDETGTIAEGKSQTKVQYHGSSYVQFDLPKYSQGNLAVNFNADSGRWNAQLICKKSKGKYYQTKLKMSDDLKGGSVIVPVEDYINCVLAVSNLGPVEFDPDSSKSRYNGQIYYYQASLIGDSLQIPKVTSLSANLMNCNGGQHLSLAGNNFFVGMQVSIDGHLAQVIEIAENEVQVLTPAIPTSGLYDLTISAPDGKPVVVASVLYNGEGCSCSCDTSSICDEDCACDPQCLLCECDVDTACSPDCACDPECTSCGCSATNKEEEKANFGWFLVVTLGLGGYFAIRRRLNYQRIGRN